MEAGLKIATTSPLRAETSSVLTNSQLAPVDLIA